MQKQPRLRRISLPIAPNLCLLCLAYIWRGGSVFLRLSNPFIPCPLRFRFPRDCAEKGKPECCLLKLIGTLSFKILNFSFCYRPATKPWTARRREGIWLSTEANSITTNQMEEIASCMSERKTWVTGPKEPGHPKRRA